MKAIDFFRQRIVYLGNSFAELVLWRLREPLGGSQYPYKYRLAFVVNEKCVLRYDNKFGKGDHRHWGDEERRYRFSNVEKLLEDFQRDIERWINENSRS